MIQANLLMSSAGKASDSFVVLDLMRLPLGILSGMGFIGAGAILRKDGLVLGVTTAATLWFATVMGLCLGGGQLELGLSALLLAVFVLRGLRWVDRKIRIDHQALLLLRIDASGPDDREIESTLRNAGLQTRSCALTYLAAEDIREMEIGVQWRAAMSDVKCPVDLQKFCRRSGVLKAEWKPSPAS